MDPAIRMQYKPNGDGMAYLLQHMERHTVRALNQVAAGLGHLLACKAKPARLSCVRGVRGVPAAGFLCT